MKEQYATRLWVNGKDIELHPFVEQFLGGTVTGGVKTLKGVDNLRTVELKILKRAVSLTVNGVTLSLTQFPSDIILNTVTALAGSLKGVEFIDDLHLEVELK